MNVTEWCRKNDIWYLKIDLEIPEACIKEAQAVYDDGFFVEHRYGTGDGWYSSALHGFVERGKDISMGWHHTKNPSGHGLKEENVLEIVEYIDTVIMNHKNSKTISIIKEKVNQMMQKYPIFNSHIYII